MPSLRAQLSDLTETMFPYCHKPYFAVSSINFNVCPETGNI
jgi:hypothetical protein